MKYTFALGLYLLAQGAAFTASGSVKSDGVLSTAGLVLCLLGAVFTWSAVDEWRPK